MAVPPLIHRVIMPYYMTGAKYSQRIFLGLVLMVFYVLNYTVNKSSLSMNMNLSPMIFSLKLKRGVLMTTSTIIMIL